MKSALFSIIFGAGLFVAATANGAGLTAATQFTVREFAGNYVLDFDPFGFFGLIQDSPHPTGLIDETFVEFDLSGVVEVEKAILRLIIHNSPPGNIPVARSFDVSHYEGSGVPNAAAFGQGSYLDTLHLEAPPDLNHAVVKQFLLDVTPQVKASISGGDTLIGFRMHDPVDITPGSDSVPHVTFQFNSARLLLVPEPSTMVMAIVLSSVVFGLRRRSEALRRA